MGSAAGGQEEAAVGLLAEAVDQDAEARGRVAEALGGLTGRKFVDEVGAEGLVEAVGRVAGQEKALGGFG